ncbi:hypothetical protein [Tropicimonas sp. IMCC34043]|uniref:hypothetical protein n=1 Tax=Tropicimonas sp. IMCC34043 TaxID=2248760 RepID=UPI000E26A0DB|nr:hypothetical protein [Tropicimonas sp. IMCC34043]
MYRTLFAALTLALALAGTAVSAMHIDSEDDGSKARHEDGAGYALTDPGFLSDTDGSKGKDKGGKDVSDNRPETDGDRGEARKSAETRGHFEAGHGGGRDMSEFHFGLTDGDRHEFHDNRLDDRGRRLVISVLGDRDRDRARNRDRPLMFTDMKGPLKGCEIDEPSRPYHGGNGPRDPHDPLNTAPVPLPAAGLLLAGAIGGVAAFSARRRRR